MDLYPPVGDDFVDALGEDLRARVKSELEPGERLLWAGRSFPPAPSVGVAYFVWLAIALILITFGVAAIIYALGEQRIRPNNETPMSLGFTLSLAGCIIFVCAIGTWISKRAQRRREANVCYAVTDRRAISWIPEAGTDAVRVRSLHRGRIGDVVRIERPDGSGSLEFTLCKDENFHWPPTGFQHILEVRRVEQIVRNNLTTREDPPVIDIGVRPGRQLPR